MPKEKTVKNPRTLGTPGTPGDKRHPHTQREGALLSQREMTPKDKHKFNGISK